MARVDVERGPGSRQPKPVRPQAMAHQCSDTRKMFRAERNRSATGLALRFSQAAIGVAPSGHLMSERRSACRNRRSRVGKQKASRNDGSQQRKEDDNRLSKRPLLRCADLSCPPDHGFGGGAT